MPGLLPWRRRSGPVVHRSERGRQALVVGLHGYGGDERQLDTLLPLSLPTVTVMPRAPYRVEPGFGWWLPETVPPSAATEGDPPVLELAPTRGVDRAVATVAEAIETAQRVEAIGPHRTLLVGYSQGATLALSVAARHPDLLAGVAVGAGFLLPDEHVVVGRRVLDVLVMNGALDPVVKAEDHRNTVDRFRRAAAIAGAEPRVTERIDPVPHVIDDEQAAFASATIADWLSTWPSAPSS